MMTENRKTAAAVTIGCRLNQAETALLHERLQQHGFAIVEPATRDALTLCILNSCTVTATATRKSRQAVRKIRKAHPEACIVVTGCSTETEADYWKADQDTDVVVPNRYKSQLMHFVDNYFFGTPMPPLDTLADKGPTFSENAIAYTPFRSRSFVKIQEGCNAFCSYCIVPYARGRERSRNWDEILKEVHLHLEAGYREVVLTGVNICAYQDGTRRLSDLVAALVEIPGDFRIRLSSTEPHPANHDLLEIIADSNKVCRFLHLPLQHGSDAILKAMNRPYTQHDYAAFAHKAVSRIPGIHLGTDVIVGFPGETDRCFRESCDFIASIPFGNIHIFTYSKRAGTPAADYPDQVHGSVAKERYQELADLAQASAESFAASHVGKKLTILAEKKPSTNIVEGWSDNYLRVRVKGKNPPCNALITGTITAQRDDNVLLADALSDEATAST